MAVHLFDKLERHPGYSNIVAGDKRRGCSQVGLHEYFDDDDDERGKAYLSM